MTHCYLRAMSPIHLKCRDSVWFWFLVSQTSLTQILKIWASGPRCRLYVTFDPWSANNLSCWFWVALTIFLYQWYISQSIMAFNQLWGLVACHSYGNAGMRVSFPVRQMLRLLSQSISRNIERLSYAQRLHTRKLVCIQISSSAQAELYFLTSILFLRCHRSTHCLLIIIRYVFLIPTDAVSWWISFRVHFCVPRLDTLSAMQMTYLDYLMQISVYSSLVREPRFWDQIVTVKKFWLWQNIYGSSNLSE